MVKLRIFGFLILIAGIVCLFISNYIMEQVNEGKLQVAAGEKKVQQGQQMFSGNPLSEQIGGALTNSANKKIAKGKQQIGYYENVANNFENAGYIGIIVGAGFVLYSFFGKKKR